MLFTQQIECGECRLLGGTRTRVSQNGTAGLEPAVEPQRLPSLAIVNPTALPAGSARDQARRWTLLVENPAADMPLRHTDKRKFCVL